MQQAEKIEWLAPQYEHKDQSMDWFWALGVIIVATAITAIIYRNYFFAILIILGGLLLGYFTVKKPEMIDYELNEKGLRMKNRLHPYEEIKTFWIRKEGKPMLFINSGRIFLPIISMPIYSNLADKIRAKMLEKNVEEVEMKDHPSVGILEFLGF